MRNTECVAFTPKASHLAISFGSGPIKFSAAYFFSDDKCTVTRQIYSMAGPDHPKKKGADDCLNIKKEKLGEMRSVKFGGG